MRKIFTILFIMVFTSALIIYGEGGTERYNNENNMETVRSISHLDGVREAAVLSRKNSVLAGVLLDNRDKRDIIYNEVFDLIAQEFPKAKDIVLELDSDRAIDIIELSYYIETDLKERVLIQRFNYLSRF